MKRVSIAKLVSLVSFTLLVACESESASVGIKLEAMSFAGSEWSEPVNLAAINTGAAEAQATFSPDELSLYFQSDRTGDPDIWVSHRACRECDWEPPVNLGPVINTTFIENGPALSIDGHLLFFFSNRPGVGGNDIYVSRRTDTHDDFAWGPPEILGSDVNTTGDENAPHYQQSAEPGGAELYFTRGPGARRDKTCTLRPSRGTVRRLGPQCSSRNSTTRRPTTQPRRSGPTGRKSGSIEVPQRGDWVSPISGCPRVATRTTRGPRQRIRGHRSIPSPSTSSRVCPSTAKRWSGPPIARVVCQPPTVFRAWTSGCRPAR